MIVLSGKYLKRLKQHLMNIKKVLKILLKKDPSNSADLAEFQAAMAAHSVLLNFMSTTIKAYKENAQTILGNMR
ncbi:EscF/YscF/HrpA family type III secretion system needle major subunit [Arsenophonus endosymbiont of Crataerina pallida]|uniref:EscF/YscF/HrpA family type III secretion system needle major subunit n=1 Tax=Arsenophonus endosymbiont of Crataerina pallida TaxID=3066235 RepID=UPI0030CA7C72